jgi:hypothetical protein
MRIAKDLGLMEKNKDMRDIVKNDYKGEEK